MKREGHDHTSWMQGYATALEMANADLHREQIEQIRRDHGYSDESEKRMSDRMLGGREVTA